MTDSTPTLEKIQQFKSESVTVFQSLRENASEPLISRKKNEVSRILNARDSYIADILREVATFNRLGEELLYSAAQKMVEVEYPKGHIILQQDEMGTAFYVVEEGEVVVMVRIFIYYEPLIMSLF